MSVRTRLDRFLSMTTGINRGAVRLMLAKGRVQVDGVTARDIQQIVHQFSVITLDGTVLQENKPVYFMMNKPLGVVSATRDKKHKTVIDLMPPCDSSSLHIAGRLDFNSSGLLLLTNDGAWSRNLSSPENRVKKYYRVTLEKPVMKEYIQTFRAGIYFDYEGITTQPAELTILSEYLAEITVIEGRYHHIKRLFGHFQNRVLNLHRYRIGNLNLDSRLALGQYRTLSENEMRDIVESDPS
ncbi:MAG: rRNA pseudouridine synthase [Pseudomonadales bacterium]|nr:rRNA pseudouridine synthase [Pseudomonadales bacterium]